MQIHRQRHREVRSENQFLSILGQLQKRSKSDAGIHIVRGRAGNLVRKNGLMLVKNTKCQIKGNQHTYKWAMSDFLTCAFGCDRKHGKRIKSQAGQALALGMSPATVCYMRAIVAGAVLARQANMLARLYLLCRQQQPLVTSLREGFDETSQMITVRGEKGSWQVCVVRHTLVIIFPPSDGQTQPRLMKVPVVTRSDKQEVAFLFDLIVGHFINNW